MAAAAVAAAASGRTDPQYTNVPILYTIYTILEILNTILEICIRNLFNIYTNYSLYESTDYDNAHNNYDIPTTIMNTDLR